MSMLKSVFVLLCFIFSQNLFPKVIIVTHNYNRPDFIALQQKCFKKFLRDEFEFVVFNDGPTEKLAKQIEYQCQILGIACYKVPQEIHQQPYLYRDPWEDWNSPSIRTANAIQYSFDTFAFNCDDIVAVIDSDMFLIQPFSITDYLQNYDLSAVGQWRGSMGNIQYLWNGIMFFNMHTLPNKQALNFNCGTINGNHTDTGGYTYYYLKENPGAKILYMRDQLDLTDGDYIANSYELEGREYLSEHEVVHALSGNEDLLDLIRKKPDDIQFFLNYAFLHYRRGGNYHGKPNNYHRKKTAILNEFFNTILD
jgi:glycosyltransferase involved in cell wall biosynthesis